MVHTNASRWFKINNLDNYDELFDDTLLRGYGPILKALFKHLESLYPNIYSVQNLDTPTRIPGYINSILKFYLVYNNRPNSFRDYTNGSRGWYF